MTNATIEMMVRDLKSKQAECEQLRARIAELADGVQSRDEEIKTLNAGLERLRNRKCEMSIGPSVDERLQAQRETIERLRAELDELDNVQAAALIRQENERLRAELAAVKEDLDAEHSVSDVDAGCWYRFHSILATSPRSSRSGNSALRISGVLIKGYHPWLEEASDD